MKLFPFDFRNARRCGLRRFSTGFHFIVLQKRWLHLKSIDQSRRARPAAAVGVGTVVYRTNGRRGPGPTGQALHERSGKQWPWAAAVAMVIRQTSASLSA